MAQVVSAPRGTLMSTVARAFCLHQAHDTPDSNHDTYQPWDRSHTSPGRCSLQGQCYPLHSVQLGISYHLWARCSSSLQMP